MVTKNRKHIIDAIETLQEFIATEWQGKGVAAEMIKNNKGVFLKLMDEVIELLNQSRAMFPWTMEEVQYLKEMFDEDNTFVEISDELRRSKGAIVGRLIREGVLPDDFLEHNQKYVTKKSDIIYREDACL